MAKISNLDIVIKPFGLSTSIGDASTLKAITGSAVCLSEFDIDLPGAGAKPLVTDVLEYICPQLYQFGVQLSFDIETSQGEQYFKSFALSKLFGLNLTGGSESKAFETKSFMDDGNCWHWDAYLKSGGYNMGKTIAELNAVDVSNLLRLQLDYGVAPPKH